MNVRPGSIIEITSVNKESAWYEDFVNGTLDLIYRVTEQTVITACGVWGLESIPEGLPTSFYKPTYKVLFY